MSQIQTKWIANGAVTNAKQAPLPANTIKGNNTGSTATATDLSIAQVQALLSIPTTGTPLAINAGGTGQTTASAAFNALSPVTALGDLIRGTGTNTTGRLAIGTTGQVLTVVGGTAAWATATAGANQTLSNLTSPTAINQDLIFATGTAANLKTQDSAAASTKSLFVTSGNATGFASGDLVLSSGTSDTGTGQVQVSSGNTTAADVASGQMSFISGSCTGTGFSGQVNMGTGGVVDGHSGEFQIATGNATGTGSSGGVNISSGNAGASTGGVNLNSGSSTSSTSGAVGMQSGSAGPGFATGNANLNTSDTTGAANSGLIIIGTGNGDSTGGSGQVIVQSGNGGTITGNMTIQTGAASAGDSGNLLLATGTATGTRGKIQLVDGSEGTAGWVWTSTDTLGNGNWADLSGTFVPQSAVGANNGVASLDAGGKIPASQLPNSVMEYLGTWAASTNTPTLADGTGNAGDVYVASDAGTVDFGSGPITFDAGDWVVYSGSVWQKSVNSNAVASVNGQTGVVVVDAINELTGDITAGPASGSASAAASLVATSNATLATLSALTTASALSTVGTITSGIWNGTTIAIANGGTGQTSAAAAFNALNPMTTTGDLIYESASNTASRLAIGGTGNVLTVVGGVPTWQAPAASATATEDVITLSGTDITNQFVDLAHPAQGASASVNSVKVSIVGGPEQLKTVDYTVSLTGGAGGVTRITFAGDLATGGNAALIAGDIMMISYSF